MSDPVGQEGPMVSGLRAIQPGQGVLEPHVFQEVRDVLSRINFIDEPDYSGLSSTYQYVATLHLHTSIGVM